ncbi:TonB-dependent receptor [Fulvivirgaceae bacterium PWU4]|uniref:TonB-dependent receptor n=1 Tax=Chryseosolibacter histidini TaxID=2782349 RepID=A0AAP2DJH7_9BACT|nr:TonB-dependent receptor [Chryseosolibacter histidini]MBT1697430.1 TonB-dependent receptor [Chryseosolibacter histidini]
MRSKVFSIVFFCCVSLSAFSQYRLSGTVSAQEDSTAIKECVVYLNDGKSSTMADGRGRFLFEDLPNGSYILHFTSPGFQYHQQPVTIQNNNQHVRVRLASRAETLEEITVTDAAVDFGFTRMRSVENMGIYEGKKSEVIIPEQLTVNLATNNARQIYSKVAGINIWENDGAGLQLSIGGRGLDPNRTSNFNVRQNGYDISADALGYPESYYTPPVEGIGRIEIVRGAASLQYGTQFGGLINFIMKKPVADRKLALVARQTAGSFGFYNAFTSASGTANKLSYYTFFQYKRGDGWRDNSHFNNHTFFANINYAVTPKMKIGVDVTQMGYLAQQPGGLTDDMFRTDPRQTNRERNWFKVNWNLLALHLDHKISATSDLNLRLFGLSAYRYSLGFRPNRVATIDDSSERDLIKGDFTNWGAEARFLKRYSIGKVPSVVLVGSRFYKGFNHSVQGLGSTSRDADFNFVNPDEYITYDYRFPNRNVSLFAENIFYVHEKFSITPGIRFEHIRTTAEGYYDTVFKDLAGNVLERTRTEEDRVKGRHFLLAGIGLSYKPLTHVELYTNISQNYRSITFSDMRIANPSSEIDPNLQDEKGYSFDLGVRSEQTVLFNYDVSVFYLNYDNRIGEVQTYDERERVVRRRGNIGRAVIQGVEAYAEADVLGLIFPQQYQWSGVVFNNIALIHSVYEASDIPGVTGNEVEFVPAVNLKSGVRLGYGNLRGSFQYTYLSDQFADATNATDGGVSAVVGTIPAYAIMDVSLSYQLKKLRFEASVNNLADRMYFTRRATGYPGPGILPSDGRGYFLTIQVKI